MKRLVATCLGVTLGLPVTAAAQLPLMGGSYGQTLRLVITADDRAHAGSGCSALARILTRELLPAAERAFDLAPGQSGFVDVNLSPLAGSLRRRVELLPAVSVRGGSCAAAVEIYENVTGRTMASVPVLLLPASDGPLTPVGASLGQIIRLGVVAKGFDPQPDPPAPACDAVLAFADADGNPVGRTRAVALQPGGSAVLDLDPSLLLPASGDPLRIRRFVRPQLLLPASGGDTRGCAVSVQVFDRLTGWTSAAYTPR